MWSTLLALPVVGIAAMLQVAVFSRITLLSGSADLLLVIVAAWALQERVRSAWYWALFAGLLIAFASGLPWYVSLAGYLLTAGIGRLVARWIWQAPLLAMFLVTTLSSLLFQGLSLLVLIISGHPLPLIDSLTLVILPGILLNLVLAVPVHALLRDLARALHPSVEPE